MAENTKIQWAHHTFNPWRGCTKVSDGCKNCYADQMSGRNPKVLGVWGKNGTRVVASESMWKQPLKWNRDAEAAGERSRVFCASLADVFESRDTMPESAWSAVAHARLRLFELIDLTPHLDWLLLTKRPENVRPIISEEISLGTYPDSWNLQEHMPNVWIGTTVENQAEADKRIPHLLKIPAAVRFLSCEPLLGPVQIERYLKHKKWWMGECPTCGWIGNTGFADGGGQIADTGDYDDPICPVCFESAEGTNIVLDDAPTDGVDWVIVGGESGPGSRPCDEAWFHSMVGQCNAAGVPVFVKQMGSVPMELGTVWTSRQTARLLNAHNDRHVPPDFVPLKYNDKKGGEITEWPASLQVREIPEVTTC